MWGVGETEDKKLLLATLESFQTGTLTPLLKEELRCVIQSRRLSEGKDELMVEFNPPPKPSDNLRPDEIERIEKRKEQNRRAAAKFRNKKKSEVQDIYKIYLELESRNKMLKQEVSNLEAEKDTLQLELMEVLKNHVCVIGNAAEN